MYTRHFFHWMSWGIGTVRRLLDSWVLLLPEVFWWAVVSDTRLSRIYRSLCFVHLAEGAVHTQGRGHRWLNACPLIRQGFCWHTFFPPLSYSSVWPESKYLGLGTRSSILRHGAGVAGETCSACGRLYLLTVLDRDERSVLEKRHRIWISILGWRECSRYA